MKIFCDFDNTAVQSSKAVIEIINARHGTTATVNDIKDWGYKSIFGGLSPGEIDLIYESDQLFDMLEFFDSAEDVLSEHDITFVTAGSKQNLENKEFFLSNNIKHNYRFCGVSSGIEKSKIDMHGGIQIDDRADWLDGTNASVKILFKGGNDFSWQKVEPCSDIYIANTWEEISDIINFFERDGVK